MRLLQPVCSGQPSLALQGSTLPQPGRAPAVCWHPPTSPGCHPCTAGFQHRQLRGQSEQHLMQGWSRTWLGHGTKATEWGIHLPSTDPSEDRLQECITDSPTQGEPGWRQLWDTPQLAIAHACFQPRAERHPAPLVPAVAHPKLPYAAVLSTLQ